MSGSLINSEAFLLPVLELVIAQFPFVIDGFGKTPSQHSDNGLEYLNHKVAKILEKLRIEQTKSHSRQSNDNALAQSKNTSVLRKHMGYEHIPKKHAKLINTFYQEYFNPWLNQLGLVKFKNQTVLADLLAQAKQNTDLTAAQEMQPAKNEWFASVAKPKRLA
jgi:transposase InsO family protein